MQVHRGAALKASARAETGRFRVGESAQPTHGANLSETTGPSVGQQAAGACQYKDKSSRGLADQREGSRVSRPARDDTGRKAGQAPVELPKHVQQCFNRTHRWGWLIYTWRHETPQLKSRRPYTCGSWRCEGECARFEASVTFARIKQASEPLDAAGWVYFVLTIDREGYYSGQRWADVTAAFRALGELQHKFLTRLRGMQKRNGWSVTKNQWVSVVEAHRSGWPHINLMLWCPELADELRADRAERLRIGRTERQAILVEDEVRAITQDAGFGRQSTAEGARSRDALIGYITKLSGHAMGAAIGEVAKITQAPTRAPQRFRRLRAGKCFLPPRHKDAGVTGTLVRRSYDQRGNPHVQPLHNVPAPMVSHVAECCYHEERTWIAELALPRLLRSLARPGIVSALNRGPPLNEGSEGKWQKTRGATRRTKESE
jgi:hypothetical protein